MYLITLLVFSVFITSSVSSKCYWNNGCPYTYFSSKTAYNLVRGDIRDSVVNLDGCQAVSIWGLIRHGKRSPGFIYASHMKNVINLRDYVIRNYEQGKSSLCAQDVENLRNWQPDSDLFAKTHSLTDEGYIEMVGIASRLREAFSELLERFDEGTYRFRSAYGHWIEDGVSGFIRGLTNETLNIEKSNSTYDIVAPYEACPKYRNDVRKNPLTFGEIAKYEETSEFKNMKLALEKRVGVQSLNSTDINAIYDLCRYVWSGINNKRSPWCALLTQKDLEILEYSGDMRHYYRNGYGTPINEIFGRIPMSDLYTSFLDVIEGGRNKLTTYFSHATMMDMVITAIGLFKDEYPLSADYRDPNRKWKSSKIAVFAANIIAVLNKCSTNNDTTEYKVVFYLNEDLLTEICNGGICSWQEFEDIFKPFLNTNKQFCTKRSSLENTFKFK